MDMDVIENKIKCVLIAMQLSSIIFVVSRRLHNANDVN